MGPIKAFSGFFLWPTHFWPKKAYFSCCNHSLFGFLRGRSLVTGYIPQFLGMFLYLSWVQESCPRDRDVSHRLRDSSPGTTHSQTQHTCTHTYILLRNLLGVFTSAGDHYHGKTENLQNIWNLSYCPKINQRTGMLLLNYIFQLLITVACCLIEANYQKQLTYTDPSLLVFSFNHMKFRQLP